VIADAALRKIVGADALGTVARADLAFAFGGACRIELGAFQVVKLGPQHRHRLCLVLVLRTLGLHVNGDAARNMRHPDGGFGLVNVLAAGTA
jgi:hypothetical protein